MTFGKNKICKIFNITYPIIQGGMVWVSGGKLAAAVANAGCLGLIGAGSMDPKLLIHHIQKAKSLTQKPFGVNIPLLYHKVEEQIDAALSMGIKIFVTSAGSPKKYTQQLKKEGAIVFHVVSHPKLGISCKDAGVDGVIAEGFEAGGHNGRDELTTFTLIPQIVDALGDFPVIAAGGIADGRTIMAAFALGAQGVQMGTRFLATQESSAHLNFKKAIINTQPSDTDLCLKELVPVRLLKNDFYHKIKAIEKKTDHTIEELQNALGKGRAKMGMLEGDLIEGELEVGQICSMIKDIPYVEDLVKKLIQECETIRKQLHWIE